MTDRLALSSSAWALVPLAAGLVALIGASVVVSSVLPSWRGWPWRRRPRRDLVGPLPNQRRVVTGHPIVLPPTATPARAIRLAPTRRRPTRAHVQAAESLIDYYLATDPEILAAVLSSWIAADDRPPKERRP